MKTIQILSVVLLIFLAIFTSSCKKDSASPDTTPNTSAEAKLDLGNSVSAKFFGVVEDETGNPVSGAAITAGNKTATTDDNGVFIIDDANVFEKLAYVTAAKTGYFLGSRSVIPSTTATNNIRITLLDKTAIATVNSGEEKTVSLPGGAKIDFKGDYVDLDGNAYSGTVNVAFKHLPALAPETADQMPGMLYAQNNNEEAGVLQTFGMIAVELTSSTGEELQINPNSTATIYMPVDAAQLSNAPATIPLWHFDEVAGYWIEDGEASLVNGEYVGEVSHFSFWNCDVFGDDATISGIAKDQNGNPLSGADVYVVTPLASTIGQTNSNGTFFTYVPANEAITLAVLDDCGNSISPINVGPYTTGSSNNETLTATLSASNSAQVSGLFYDCNNNLITNGYIYLTAGAKPYSQTITNGVVDIPILFCNIPADLTVIAYDYDNLEETNTITVPVVSPVTNLGNLIACNSISEYITYSIDGGSPETIAPPFDCRPDGGQYVYITNNNSNFQYNGPSALGSYSYAQILFLTSNSINIDQGQNVSITFDLLSYGAVGSYVDINFSGTYTDANTNSLRTISGSIHVIRDL